MAVCQSCNYGANYIIFGSLGLSVVSGTITDYNVQVAWTNTGILEQIKEYFIFYKPVREENQQIKNGWSFKRSTQPSTTLAPLQPATGYVVSVLGYTSSRKVYGSNDVRFQTTGGIVTLTFKYSRLLSLSAARDLKFRSERRGLFPFRKRSLPFLTVDATIDNQGFRHDGCNIFFGLSCNKANYTFLNSFRKNEVETQVEFTLKIMEKASRVTCY